MVRGFEPEQRTNLRESITAVAGKGSCFGFPAALAANFQALCNRERFWCGASAH